MKIVTYNLNGIRARLPRLIEYLDEQKPDVLCLQEIKCDDDAFPIVEIRAAGYDGVWHGQKGFNGVAILTPAARRRRCAASGLPGDPDDTHSRYIEAEVDGRRRRLDLSAQRQSGRHREVRLQARLDGSAARPCASSCSPRSGRSCSPATGTSSRPTIPTTSSRPGRWRSDALMQPESRAAFRRILNLGFTDAIRARYPDGAGLHLLGLYRRLLAARRGLPHRPSAAVAAGRRPAARCRRRQGVSRPREGQRPRADLGRSRRLSALGRRHCTISSPPSWPSRSIRAWPTMAAAIAARLSAARRGRCCSTARACRQRELDGLMLDFYLIVSDYREAYGRGWLAFANRLIPPNVFPFEHDGLAAKYAVLSEADFARECGPEARQRLGLGAVRPAVAAGLGERTRRRGRGRSRRWRGRRRPCSRSPGRRWRTDATIRSRSWRARLRAHLSAPSCGPSGRSEPGSIVDAEPERYRRFGAAALAGRPRAEPAPDAARRARWRRRRRKGKALTLVRLAKASDDLRRRRRLSRLEDQPPCRDGDRGEALAAALAAARRAYSAASSVAAGRDPLSRPRPSAAATARGEGGDGEGLAQQLVAGEVLGLARLADIAGDEQDARSSG